MRLPLSVIAALFLTVSALEPDAQDAGRVERRLSAMGTSLSLTVLAADRPTALQASEAAVRAIETVEARLSTWREDSELSRLNRTPVGAAFRLSPPLAEDLARVQRQWTATGGAFDPGIGALVRAWGLREGGRRPSHEELARTRAGGGWSAFQMKEGYVVRGHDLALVEEGGFGKGIGLDAALQAAATAGARGAVVDLGGQLALFGLDEAFTTGVADPRDRERVVCTLTLDSGSFATSGNSERGIEIDGERRSHLLDPRTGEPAPDFGSVSVWCADATAADCLSTALYVMGPGEALAWAQEHDGVEALVLEVVGGRLRARATPGLEGRLRMVAGGDVEPEFVSDGPSHAIREARQK